MDFESASQRTALAGFFYSKTPLGDQFSGSVSGSATVVLPVSFASASEIFVKFRFRLDADPPDRPWLFDVLDTAGARQLHFELGTSGNGLKTMRAGDKDFVDQNPTLVKDHSYVIGVHMKIGTGNALQVTYAEGTASPILIVNRDLPDAKLPLEKLRFGNLAASTLSATFDDIKVSTKPLP